MKSFYQPFISFSLAFIWRKDKPSGKKQQVLTGTRLPKEQLHELNLFSQLLPCVQPFVLHQESPSTNYSNRQLIMRFQKGSNKKEMFVLKNHQLFILKRGKNNRTTLYNSIQNFFLPCNLKRAKSIFISEYHFLLLDFSTVGFPQRIFDYLIIF